LLAIPHKQHDIAQGSVKTVYTFRVIGTAYLVLRTELLLMLILEEGKAVQVVQVVFDPKPSFYGKSS